MQPVDGGGIHNYVFTFSSLKVGSLKNMYRKLHAAFLLWNVN